MTIFSVPLFLGPVCVEWLPRRIRSGRALSLSLSPVRLLAQVRAPGCAPKDSMSLPLPLSSWPWRLILDLLRASRHRFCAARTGGDPLHGKDFTGKSHVLLPSLASRIHPQGPQADLLREKLCPGPVLFFAFWHFFMTDGSAHIKDAKTYLNDARTKAGALLIGKRSIVSLPKQVQSVCP